MFLKNTDKLFEKPHMTAALDGEYFGLWQGWPHFNSGFLVIKPSHELFEDILNFAMNFPKEKYPNYVIAD
jgi:alpha-N-acetylglucosamine transferase